MPDDEFDEDEPKDLERRRGMVPAPDSDVDRPRPAEGRLSNLAIAGVVAGSLAVAALIILLATQVLGSDDSDGSSATPEETVVTETTTSAQTSTAAESTTTESTTAEPTTTTAGGSDEADRQAAVELVESKGYDVFDPNAYRTDNTLAALVGTGANGAPGSPSQAFFFVDGNFIGTDTKDPSLSIQLASSDDTEAAISYRLYNAGDPDDAPTGETVTVRFGWDGSKLTPLDPIPTSDPDEDGSRR